MDIFNLIEQLTNRDMWPGFRDPDRLNLLDQLAVEAFERNTFDGTLACVLITHQICDELLRHLIAQSRFTIRIAMASSAFEVRFGRHDDDSDLDGLMTGQLLKKIEESVEFEHKQNILLLSREMSDIRNRFAHELATGVNLSGMRGTATRYREKFIDLEKLYENTADDFRLYFKDHRKSDFWDHLLVDILNDGLEPEHYHKCQEVIQLRSMAGFG